MSNGVLINEEKKMLVRDCSMRVILGIAAIDI